MDSKDTTPDDNLHENRFQSTRSQCRGIPFRGSGVKKHRLVGLTVLGSGLCVGQTTTACVSSPDI